MADAEEDFSKLPLEARLTHKAWKARQQAYDELSRQFRLATSQKDPVFKDHQDIVRKLPTESNAVVLENALNCLITCLECAPIDILKRIKSDVLPVLVEKGLGAQRAGAKNKAVECFNLFVELENGEAVIGELCNAFAHKQPKLAAAAVNCTCELLRAFGSQVISVKVIGKHLAAVFGNPDKNVRAEATQLTVEIYRWIGTAINVFLGEIKAIQSKELQELFSKETFGQCRPTKYLRSSKAQTQNATVQATQAVHTESESLPDVIKPVDAFDLVDPVDVLSNLPADFETLVTSSNWKERKEVLGALLSILKVPKIMDGHFGELIDHLLKRVGDVNVLVVVVAANCLEALISGLRNLFVPYRSIVLPALLERCKEKKANVVDALRGALNALFMCTQTFESVIEDMRSFLTHKNPQIKAETFAWLGRLIPQLKQPIPKKDVKLIVEVCIPGLEDGATEVRDMAARAIAKLYQLSGEKNIAPLLDGVDKIKLAKITEFAKETDELAKPVPVVVQQPIPPSAMSMPEKRTAAPEPVKTMQKQIKQFDPLDYSTSPKYTESQTYDFFLKIVSTETITLLNDPVWKTRLTAVEEVISKVDQMCYTEGFDTELLVLFLGKHPGWKDSNFQVIGKMITICQLVSKQHSFTREAVASLVPELVDKLSDPKLKKSSEDLLLTLSEQTYCGFVLYHLCEASKSQKSPKNLTEIVGCIQSCLLEFGTTLGINVKELIEFAKVQLGNSNAALRTASVSLVGTIGNLVNQDIMPLFGDVQPQLRSTLQAELAKVHEPIVPKRRQKYFAPEESSDQKTSNITAIQSQPIQNSIPIQYEPVEDLIPRVDITASITPAILAQLADPNWKVRKEGLDQVAAIVDAANHRVKLTSGELYNELRARLGDSNKILVMQALSLCASLAEASGQAADKYTRSVISAIISCLADGKIQVRQEALRCLDQIIQVSPMSSVISQAPSCLLTDSPNLRKELLTWLASKLPFYKSFTTEEALSLVQPSINCLQDRTAEVRKAAQGILGALADVCGMHEFKRRCIEIQSNIWSTIQPFVDSYKPAEVVPSQQTAPTTINLPMKRQATTPRKAEAGQLKKLLFSTTTTSDQKLVRAEKDKGSVKWNGPDGFVIRQDLIDILREQLSTTVETSLLSLLFSDDFKLQIQGMSLIESSTEECATEIINSLDLLLKYIVYRMVENNPTVFLKCLDLLERLVSLADRSNYRLSEYEGSCLLPSLVLKSGESKDSQRPRLRQLFRQLCRIYPASKLFTHLIDGLKSKGAKTRSECLEEMHCLLGRNGLSVLIPVKHVPIIGTMVGDRDAGVRSAALNVLVQTANLLGDQSALLKHLSGCSQKELDMFEERMKRSRNPGTVVDEDAKSLKSSSVDEVSSSKDAVITTPTRNTPSKFKLEFSADTPTPKQRQAIFSDPTPVLNVRPFPTSQTSLPHPLDHIVDQVLTAADLPCIQALQRLDEQLSQTNKDTFDRLDNLIAALSIRLKECCDSSSTAYLLNDPEMRVLKGRMALQVINSLLLLIEDRDLATKIESDRLQQLIFETLNSLISQPINHLYEERDILIKHINALLVSILENARYDTCFSALLSILEQIFLIPPTTNSKVHELTMKCLWKITKQMHVRHSDLEIGVLLQAVHHFFSSISPIEWKSRAAEKLPFEDMPLRTVKTILHELTQAVGPRVLDEAKTILPKTSFVISYLLNMVNSIVTKESNSEPAPSGGLVQPSSTPMMQLTREELCDRLKIICSQICSKPDTNMGLMELYRFKQEHSSYASTDIDAFLASLGDFFHKYITRSLARIESEQAQLDAHQSGNSPSADASADSFKSKLTLLRRQMFGSLSGSASNSSTEKVNEDVKMSPISTRIANSPSLKPRTSDAHTDAYGEGKPTMSSIVGLKERLARLRGTQPTS